MGDEPLLLTVREAAKLLRISAALAYALSSAAGAASFVPSARYWDVGGRSLLNPRGGTGPHWFLDRDATRRARQSAR